MIAPNHAANPAENRQYTIQIDGTGLQEALKELAVLPVGKRLTLACGNVLLDIGLANPDGDQHQYEVSTKFDSTNYLQNPAGPNFSTFARSTDFPAVLFDTCILKAGSMIQIGPLQFRLPNHQLSADPFLKLRAAATCFTFGELLANDRHRFTSGETLHGQYSSLIDQGYGKRSSNQDVTAVRLTPDGRACLVVCDGMGGRGGGDFAARCVTESILDQVQQGASLPEALRGSAQTLLHRFYIDKLPSEYKHMGTCVSAAEIERDRVTIAHVGDTRAYLIRNSANPEIIFRTRDHSKLQDAIDRGLVQPADARSSPIRNVVNRFIGLDSNGINSQPDVESRSISRGDVLILSSDGLWENLYDGDMLTLVRNHHDPIALSKALHQAALSEIERSAAQRGGRGLNDDNIGLIVYRHDW